MPNEDGGVVDATNPPSPKTIAATITSLIVPGILAALMYLQTAQGIALYAALPVLLVVAIKSLITGVLTFLVSYQVSDPQRILDLATSPKVFAATGASIVLTVVSDLIAYLLSSDGQTLYANWPPIAIVAFAAVLPAVGAFVGGFLTKDPARRTSKNLTPVATKPPVGKH